MISWVAIDRIVKGQMTSDAKYRKEAAGRPIRSHAECLDDGELIAKLRSFGIDLDRSLLERLCKEALSAEEIARPLFAKCAFETHEDKQQGDWVWICLDALWQRWFPEIPSFEMLDDKMQAGYERFYSGNVEDACRSWLGAWNDVLHICDRAGFRSIEEFDDRFMGTQCLSNWIQDLEIELWNVGLDDRRFLTGRISLCEEALRRFEFQADDDLLAENLRRALAESYFALGEIGKADALYRTWLDKDPRWGWGWIGWSDCYRFASTELRDSHKAEALLQEGFSVTGVRDFKDLAERLADLYQEMGRVDESEEIRRQAEMISPEFEHTVEIQPGANVVRQKTIVNFGDEGLPLSELPKLANKLRASSAPVTGSKQKIGRNDPCPCGSGKKFKKCCYPD